MSEREQNLGGRLPLLDPAAMTAAQRELYSELKSTWVVYAKDLGVQATTDDGRLIGPFNMLLLHPEIAEKLDDFQAAEAKNTTLSKRVREVIILMVGAVWAASYELYAQTPAARKLGFSEQAISTLAEGKVPEDLSDEEKIAAHLAKQLATSHRVDPETYHAAEQAFGTKGLFDIVAVMGEYQTVCGGLCLFDVPVPNTL